MLPFSYFAFDSTQLLSCLRSVVVEHLHSKQYIMVLSPESHLSSFFLSIFYGECVIQISCIALFSFM